MSTAIEGYFLICQVVGFLTVTAAVILLALRIVDLLVNFFF